MSYISYQVDILRRFLCHLPHLERWLWGKNKRVSIYLSALYSLTLQTPCTMHQELYVFDPKDTLKQVVCVRLYISCSYLLPSLMAVFYQSNCPPNEQFKKIIYFFQKIFFHSFSPLGFVFETFCFKIRQGGERADKNRYFLQTKTHSSSSQICRKMSAFNVLFLWIVSLISALQKFLTDKSFIL